MNTLRWVLFAALLVLAVVSIGGYLLTRAAHGGRPAVKSAASAKATLYRCPMHPSYTSDRPGECPICGMTLERVIETGPGAGAGASDVPGLVPVTIGLERVQRIGVRTAVAMRMPLGEDAQLTGFVAPDESRLRRVQLRVSGWVRSLVASRTGEVVHAGQPLLTLYSPELYQSEREYLIELSAGPAAAAHPGHDGGSHEAGARAAGRERLTLFGVPEDEIARLERERTAVEQLVLRAPVTGTVLERNVMEGQYVGPDTPLLTLAELSRVWVLADVYEMDVTRVHVGDPVRFVADGLPGRTFAGRIEFIAPVVSSETRTVRARIALENGDGALKPGMFGRVEIGAHGAAVLTVPSEAVVRTGREDYVFIARAGGRFEPRLVTPGASVGDLVQILHGLAAGDTVVASASFLIDSESRLKAAIEGLGSQPGAAPASTPAPGAPPAHRH
jgi:multidrug efflux pump subunit AcrA (membrane-fusion protein)